MLAGSDVAGDFAFSACLASVGAWLIATAAVAGVVDAAAGDVEALAALVRDGVTPIVALVLFAGAPRDGDLPGALRARGAHVLAIDVLIGGRLHDVHNQTEGGVAMHLLRAAERGHIASVHSALPCETHSVGLGRGDIKRTRAHPLGIPGLPASMQLQCDLVNALLGFVLDISAAVVRLGGQASIEHPADRGNPAEPKSYWADKADSASIFQPDFRPVQEYAALVGATLITTPLCAFGLPMQKYIMVLASGGMMPVLREAGAMVCTCARHEEVAYGPDGGGLRSSQYPPAFCDLLARALLHAHVGSTEDAVAPVRAQVAATTAPGYVPPADPGWWAAEEDDLSDGEAGTATAVVGGHVCAYKACVKRKVKFSVDGDVTRRHDIPNGLDEAMCHEDAQLLWEAVLREHGAQIDCKTWEERDARECYEEGGVPIGCQWVFDAKIDNTSRALVMWKARLVARGDQMRFSRDFFETYAGVCRISSLRVFFALAAMWALVLTGADVSTAYLHAPLRDARVWMQPPRGFPQTFPDGRPMLLLLRMALYGLRQSAREWAITLREWLLAWRYEGQHSFRRFDSDSYIFMLQAGSARLVLLVYVDDIFMGHTCARLRGAFMAAFRARFRVKDLGALTAAVGMDVQQDLEAGTVSISQGRYILDRARRYSLDSDHQWADIPVPVKLAKECRAAQPSRSEYDETNEMCMALAGIVVHVATFSRPDVAYAAHLSSSLPSSYARLRLLRRILGYLARTATLRITYRRDARDAGVRGAFLPGADGTKELGSSLLPHMPVDADHAADRSISGWLFMFAGAAIMWAVRAQVQPSISSTEAELYGLSTAVCDLLAGANLLEEFGYLIDGPIRIFCDSRGARLLVADSAAPARTRHVHRRWYFVRYHREAGRISVHEIKGECNPANFLTKAVGGSAFARDRGYALGQR